MHDGQSAIDRRQLGRMLAAGGAGIALAGRALAAPDIAVPWEEQGMVERAGGSIHWVAMGKGPPVVVMPKLGGWVADWRFVAPILAKQYRVIVIDPPGHGGSKMATPPPFYQSVPESAAMIRATIQDLGIDRYALLGNSLGGCIDLVMAGLWPDEVTRLILLSSTLIAGLTRDQVLANEARGGPSTMFDAKGYPLERPFELMNAKFGLSRQIHDEMNASRAAAGLWVRPSERGVAMANLPAYLPRIKAPTLLIYGTTGSYLENRQVGLSLIPHAQAINIPGGSFLHQENPAGVAKAVGDFLASGSSTPA